MNKRFIYSLAATFITAAVTLSSFTACSNEDMVVGLNATTYTVCIPASMDGGAETRAVTFDAGGTENPTAVSSFTISDQIYVYNETKGAMLTGYLTPSAAGKTCTLTGSLTGTIEANDNLVLLYNLSNYDSNNRNYCYFFYGEQNGTKEGVIDGAKATVTASVNNDNLTTATAHFQNVQSMFRFKFVDENTNAINVKHLVITSKKNSAIVQKYSPYHSTTIYYCDVIPITLTTPTTNYIYVALCIKESVADGDELAFKAIDADGKVYTVTKAAPSGGFVNGKYYYNTSAIALTHDASQDITMPTIGWTNPSTSDVELDYNGQYKLSTPNFNITLSGTSSNCNFHNTSSGIVQFNGLNATNNGLFFYCGYDLTVGLNGENTIVSTNEAYCIYAKTLKLSGNGKLTVTAKNADYCGIYGLSNYKAENNNNPTTTTSLDVSDQLAANGHTVTRSARTDNDADNDGTPESYTWTYTVMPNP